MKWLLDAYLDHFPRLVSLVLSISPLLVSKSIFNELSKDEGLGRTLHESKITQQQLQEMIVCWITKSSFALASLILLVNVTVGGLISSRYLLLLGLPAAGLLVWGYLTPAYQHCDDTGRHRARLRPRDLCLAALIVSEAIAFQVVKSSMLHSGS